MTKAISGEGRSCTKETLRDRGKRKLYARVSEEVETVYTGDRSGTWRETETGGEEEKKRRNTGRVSPSSSFRNMNQSL